jgi:hypothetical protein
MYQYGEYFTKGKKISVQRDICDAISFAALEVVKNTAFWHICDPVDFPQRFRRTYRLLLQGRRISKERNQQAAGSITLQRVVLFIFTAVRTSDGGEVSVTRRPPFTPRRIPGIHFY